MHQVGLAIILIEKWWLKTTPEVAEHVSKSLAVPINKNPVLVPWQLMAAREHGLEHTALELAQGSLGRGHLVSAPNVQLKDIFFDAVHPLNLRHLLVPKLLS